MPLHTKNVIKFGFTAAMVIQTYEPILGKFRHAQNFGGYSLWPLLQPLQNIHSHTSCGPLCSTVKFWHFPDTVQTLYYAVVTTVIAQTIKIAVW